MSNTLLIHPGSKTTCFGKVLQMKSGSIILPAGDIVLRQGKHKGPNSGFGAAHIWEEHQKAMSALGLTSQAQVPDYVAKIVQVGTPLFFEGGYSRSTRIMAVRSSVGVAILEFQDSSTLWSIVTAYEAKQGHGTRVGAVA